MYKSVEFMKRFKYVGENVQVFENALILKPEEITLRDGCRIDDFARVEGGFGLDVGKYVHISSFCGILGGGRVYLEDYVAMAQGSRIVSGSDTKGSIMSAACPYGREVRRSVLWLKKHAFMGVNSVLMPGVSLQTGVIVGAGAVVNKDFPEWTILGGVPASIIGFRDKTIVLAKEDEKPVVTLEEFYG